MLHWKRLSLILAFLLLFVIFQSRNEEISGPFKGLLGNVLNPIVYAANSVFSGIGGVWHSYINLVDVQDKNDEYKSIIDNLTLQNTLLTEKVNQSDRLNALLKFNETYDFTTLGANVIGASDGYVKHMMIDRGNKDGIKKDDPVIGFYGLIGRVSTVYPNTADVDVILNISSNVSVINSRTRAVGILRGDGKGKLFVDYYDRLDDAKPGDLFITSGRGMLFPKGIPVGTISNIVKEQTGLFQKIYINQSEDFYKLENIFVVKDFK